MHSEHISQLRVARISLKREMYRVGLVVCHLGWVDIDACHFTACLVLGMGIWMNWLGCWEKYGEISIKVNPTHVTVHQPHPVQGDSSAL